MSAVVEQADGSDRVPWYRSYTTLVPVLIASAAVTVGILVRGAITNPYTFMDLSVYRLGVQAWLNGQDIYGRLPPTSHGEHLQFIYPPFATVPLAPLAEMSWQSAWVATGVLSVLALSITLYLVLRQVWPEAGPRGAMLAAAVLLPPSMLLEPVKETLWYGQVNLLLMALVTADCLVRKPAWPRGLLVGIAAAIKLTPAGFLMFFLLRKDFRAVTTAVITGAVATAIGFAVSWHASVRFFFGSPTGLSAAAQTPYATNQTIKAALERMNLPLGVQNGLWLGAAAVVLVLGVIGIRRALRAESSALAMVITTVTVIAVVPTAWGHHWVYVVPALVVLLAHGVRNRHAGWLAAFVLVAAAFVLEPFYWCPLLTDPVDHRMHWTVAQHFYGNTYVLLTVVLLAAYAAPEVRSAWSELRANSTRKSTALGWRGRRSVE